MRQRLLAVDVLAHLHGHDGGRGVRVVGRADRHGVDLLAHLVEHLAVVDVTFWPSGTSRACRLASVLVDVAEGDDVAEVAGLVDVAGALAADADAGDVQLLVGAEPPAQPCRPRAKIPNPATEAP